MPGPLVGTFLAAARAWWPAPAEGRAQVGVHCASATTAPAPWLVEHLASLDAAAVLPDGGVGPRRSLVQPAAEPRAGRDASPRPSTR